MAGEPAASKIVARLKTALETGMAGALVEVDADRGDDQAYGNAEIEKGAVNIIQRGTSFSMLEHGTQVHRGRFDLDLAVSIDDADTVGERLRELEAKAVEALWADRTLDGAAQDVVLIDTGGDEDVRVDEGVRPLSIEIIYLTPVGDHRTIIGATGLIP